MNSTPNKIILWEAHRGGGGGFEMPESCPLSFEYGWLLGGRPEADVNLTADGVMVSVHDSTLDRIVRDLPEELKGKLCGLYADKDKEASKINVMGRVKIDGKELEIKTGEKINTDSNDDRIT